MTSFKTQDIDVFADNDPGINFDADDQTWTISAGVLVSSGQQSAVFSSFSHSVLFNQGSLFSGGAFEAGVFFSGDASLVSNAGGGTIIGAEDGIFADGGSPEVNNLGTILGIRSNGVEFQTGSEAALENGGSISGGGVGVLILAMDGGTIRNSGLITSNRIGIRVEGGHLPTAIANAAGGIIGGPENAIFCAGGRILLENHGTISGSIEFDTLADENDLIVNLGKIMGGTSLGFGNDVFIGTGGTSGFIDGEDGNDRLVGGKQADRLFGGDGDDRLVGAFGNDRLDGGRGNDTLIGGTGNDRFVFDTQLGAAPNVDLVMDFRVGADMIELNQLGLGAPGRLAASRFHIGGGAADASDRIIYNSHNGFLFYDRDGKGGTGEIHFATPMPHLALHNTDFLVDQLLAN